MPVEAYEQETYRPIEFDTPKNVEDGLGVRIKLHCKDNSYDITNTEETVTIDHNEKKTVAICDFTKDDGVPPGHYYIVIETYDPDSSNGSKITVVSKDILILWDKTGFNLSKEEEE